MKSNVHIASACVLVTLNAIANVHASVSVTPAATVDTASSVSSILSPSYIGMGIEPSNLFAFVGTRQPNTLTNNLLGNLANYTGIPPHIRVGGNTEDLMIYDPSYNGYYLQPNPSSTSNSDSTLFGPKYFSAIDNLPNKTPVSLGIGLAYNGSDAVNMSVSIAQQAVTSLTNVNLVGLEIGNEPDLYIQTGFRPSGWSIEDYGNEWIQRVEAIYTQVLQPNNIGTAFFEAACTATTAAFPAYKISNLVGTGVGTSNGLYLAGWNQHDYYYYVGVSDYTLTISQLLQLSSTSGQFTAWSGQASEAAVTGKPYYVREMGSVGPSGIEGISNTFANALWTLNFFLFASTVGVDSVQIHMLQDSFGSPWQPITDTANEVTFVRPNYYAFAAMNQIIGAKCATKVAQTSLSGYPSSYGNRLAVYSVYDGDDLQTLVMLNTQPVYTGNTFNSQNFVASLPSLVGKTFYLSVLSASGVDATSNVTWNNMEYEQSGDGSPTNIGGTIQTATVASDGTLTVSVRDSQIVVANLGSAIGSQNNVVDSKACNALAASSSEGGASSTSSGKGAAPTFKATSGFSKGLSLGAIIGIAAGGGVALVLLLALIIICCVRRSRRNKRLAAYESKDNKTLLPPPINKVRSYANVPQRDSFDSSADHDIWMTPLGAKKGHSRYDTNSGSTTPYMNSVHSRGDSGSSTPFRHSEAYRSDGSYDHSLYEAPIVPSNTQMSEYAPLSSNGHGPRTPVPASASMPLNIAEQRRSYQAQPAVSSRLAQGSSYPNLSEYQRGRNQSQPGRVPAALVAGQQYGSRQRELSTPATATSYNRSSDQPVQRSDGQIQRTRDMAYGAARRSPSAPDLQDLAGRQPYSSSRDQRYSRDQRDFADRGARSAHGHHQSSQRDSVDRGARSAHGHSSRRGYEDAPPVPRMPAIARPPREPTAMPISRSTNAAYPSIHHVGGPRQQPIPSHQSVPHFQQQYNSNDQYSNEQYDYNQQQQRDEYDTYHAL
jgi:hypothetical protein